MERCFTFSAMGLCAFPLNERLLCDLVPVVPAAASDRGECFMASLFTCYNIKLNGRTADFSSGWFQFGARYHLRF